MKPSAYLISDAKQVAILAAPTRQEILDTLESSGPTTVAKLGALLGRAPDSLYHHLKILQRAQQAAGGSEALSAVKDMIVTRDIKAVGGGMSAGFR